MKLNASDMSLVGNLAGLPTYIRAIAVVGFPIMVTLFLLAQSAGWISSVAQVHSMESRLAVDAATARVQDHLRQQGVLSERLTVGLRVICENGALSSSARLNCANIR